MRKKLDRLRFYLFEFCKKLAEREDSQDELARQAKELAEEEEIDYKAALFRLAERKPWLVEDFSLGPFGDPDVFLDSHAEQIRGQIKWRRNQELTRVEALARARASFPAIAALSDLIHSDWALFKKACAKVGRLHPDYARQRVEELVLEEAERLREGES